MNGWIKLDRQILDNPMWKKEPFTMGQAWVDLLLMANHEDKKVLLNGEWIIVKRGQMHTSILKLSDRWKWSRGKTKRFLDVLEMDNMVNVECSVGGTTNGTTITIVKYDFFQSKRATDDTTSDTAVDTTVDTTNGQRSVQRTDINKNIKNDKKDKNEKNVKKELFGEYRNVKLTHEEYDRLGNDYGEEMRKEAIAFLDSYIEEKGYQSKSHNLAIRRWVIDAVNRQRKPKNAESDFFAALDACV